MSSRLSARKVNFQPPAMPPAIRPAKPPVKCPQNREDPSYKWPVNRLPRTSSLVNDLLLFSLIKAYVLREKHLPVRTAIYRSRQEFTGPEFTGPGKNLPVRTGIYRSLQGANTGHNKGHNKGHSKGHNKSTRQSAQQRAQQGAHQDAEQGPFPERYLRGSLRRTITACSG